MLATPYSYLFPLAIEYWHPPTRMHWCPAAAYAPSRSAMHNPTLHARNKFHPALRLLPFIPTPSFSLRPNPHYRSTPRTAGGLRNGPALGPKMTTRITRLPLLSSPLLCFALWQTMPNALLDPVTDIITFGSSASRQYPVLLRL
jgi:hypothetical protein